MDLSILSPANLQHLLEAGVAVAAAAGVEEATKDAYAKVKTKIREIFGRPGERALVALETDPSSAEAKQQIGAVVSTMEPDDLADIRPALETLISAIQQDAAAQAALERAQIRMDLDVGETANIEDIEDLESLDIRARTGKDFNFKRVSMAKRGQPGK